MADSGAEVDATEAVHDLKTHVAAAIRLATTTEGNAVDLQAKLVPEMDRVKELLSTHTGALARTAGMNYTPKQLQERWEKVHVASRVTDQRMAACVQAINDALAEANPPQ